MKGTSLERGFLSDVIMTVIELNGLLAATVAHARVEKIIRCLALIRNLGTNDASAMRTHLATHLQPQTHDNNEPADHAYNQKDDGD